MSKFYFKFFSLTTLMRIIWYSFIAWVVVFYFKQDIVTHPHLNLSLQTAKPEVIQIFCDEGNGFSEILSSTITTSIAQQNGEPFNLPLPSTCKHLRLDLGSQGAAVKITTAALVTSGGDKVDILSKIISPAALNDIKASESNQGEFVATANDPYVVLSGDFSTLTTAGYSLAATLKVLGQLAILIGIAALIILVPKKYNLQLYDVLAYRHTPLIIVVITATFLRIRYWAQSILPSEPSQLGKIWPDEGTYFSIAQFIMTHGWRDYLYAEQSVMTAPGNPIYIALMYTLTHSVNAIRSVNLLLSVLTIVLIYKLGKRIFNQPVGIIAAAMCAIHGQLIQYSATLLTEPLFLCVFIGGVYFLVFALEKVNEAHNSYLRYAFASAFLLTIAILTRSIVMLLPLFLLAVIGSMEAYRSWREGKPSFSLLKRAAFPLLLPILIVGIVATKNYLIFDRFMVATGSGAALWLGSRADTEGDDPPYRGRPYDTQVITPEASHISLKGDRLLIEAAKKNILENPLGYAWWNLKKIGRLLVGSNLAWFYPDKYITDWHRASGRDIIATTNMVFQIVLATIIAVYGIIGLVIALISPVQIPSSSLIISASVCYLVIFSIPFLAIQRYGLPLAMLLVIPASSVLYGAWLTEGRCRSLSLIGIPFTFVIVLQILFMG